LGEHIIVLDEGGYWRGAGTAWKLAEEGYQVTIVTPNPLVGKELQRTAADFPLRQRLAIIGPNRIFTERSWGTSAVASARCSSTRS
ncbi:MAG: hypothetical protein P8Y12_06380, partial [Gammaproteobacteria bacterium]